MGCGTSHPCRRILKFVTSVHNQNWVPTEKAAKRTVDTFISIWWPKGLNGLLAGSIILSLYVLPYDARGLIEPFHIVGECEDS
jgi:hypothetical protein